VVLRYYIPDGQTVKAGDVVLRIDPGQSASQIRLLDAQIEQARAKTAKELAELQVKRVDAEIAVVDAEAALATAKLDAAIPKDLISRLDYERHQGELARAQRELVLKRKELADAHAAVARRRHDANLEVEKLKVERAYHAVRVDTAEVRADRAGVVVHGFSTDRREQGRIDEGASARPGEKVGAVVGVGAMRVRAWALEPDRRGLAMGQTVQLAFDALPGRVATGRITAIAGAPNRRPEWGQGRYFAIDIALTSAAPALLLPGMSVRVMPRSGATAGASR
jgi:multidrug resistance efflux pump